MLLTGEINLNKSLSVILCFTLFNTYSIKTLSCAKFVFTLSSIVATPYINFKGIISQRRHNVNNYLLIFLRKYSKIGKV